MIITYNTISTDILDLLIKMYPNSYDYEDIYSFQNFEGKTISVIEVISFRIIYLVEISSQLEEIINKHIENKSRVNKLRRSN
ncbi:hypothetical protein [uncultured Tenacibaculum sp.]|uniref:hypothetical protein n=1 Tax=uncultured Tenacibaculum sp. TaxID=174713 RepID=UPI002635170C|nr:hypothetical protein [uncultured Tenacibaculum sp.]